MERQFVCRGLQNLPASEANTRSSRVSSVKDRMFSHSINQSINQSINVACARPCQPFRYVPPTSSVQGGNGGGPVFAPLLLRCARKGTGRPRLNSDVPCAYKLGTNDSMIRPRHEPTRIGDVAVNGIGEGAGSDLLGATGEMPTPLTPKGTGSGSASGWGGGECIAPLSEAGRCCGVQSGSGVWARPCTCAPTTARPSESPTDLYVCGR